MSALLTKIFSLIISLIMIMPWTPLRAKKNAENFRVTSYIVADTLLDYDEIDRSHFSQITDLILIGAVDFDENGNLVISENFDTAYTNLKKAIGNNSLNLYLNIIGPKYRTDSTDWNEQMNEQADYHNMAFGSANLQGNIKSFLEDYDFDGVFFDYEYPLEKEDIRIFDNFLVSLDLALGSGYKIGCAISSWSADHSAAAIRAMDMVEVMAYDIWDENGNHATVQGAKDAITEMMKYGYSRSQMDLGVPFYARPTTKEAYWYSYKNYCRSIDENGLVKDEKTGLIFSFNTYDMIYEKTQWAIELGLGGIMVWHYACDASADEPLSLFNAIYQAKLDAAE